MIYVGLASRPRRLSAIHKEIEPSQVIHGGRLGNVWPSADGRLTESDIAIAPPLGRSAVAGAATWSVVGGGVDFDALYQAERSALEIYVLACGATPQEACDAVHAAFVHLLERWESVREPRPWLRRVAVNEFRRASRRFRSGRRRSYETPTAPGDFTHSETVRSAAEVAELTEQERDVVTAIAGLPERQRRVMAYYFDGWGYEQIATQLDMKPAAVRQNLHRARKALEKRLIGSQKEVS